jgi:hypothetical protein
LCVSFLVWKLEFKKKDDQKVVEELLGEGKGTTGRWKRGEDKTGKIGGWVDTTKAPYTCMEMSH